MLENTTLQHQFESGLAHHRAGRLAEAEKIYRQILAQQPDHADASHLLGMLAAQTGQLAAAAELFRQTIQLRPDYAVAYSNLGNVLARSGRIDEAIASYRQAVQVNPEYAEAYSNLGSVLKGAGKLDEAIASYQKAIALKPDLAEAQYNQGNTLKSVERLDEAIAAFRQAIRIKSDYTEAHVNLGNALKQTGRLDEAIASCRQAIRLKPDLAEAYGNLIYTMQYRPDYDGKMIREELRRWNQQCAAPLGTFIQPHTNDRDPMRRLRIGYVSADFHDHASALFLLPLLRHHDQRQYEIFCYAQGAHGDKVEREMKALVQHWRQTEAITDADVAALIRRDQIDILVDLKLFTAGNRLLIFARKPAPVQVTWLGYPGTTGLDTVDYRLTDPYLDPGGPSDDYYWEKSIHLPDTFWCYDPLTNEPAVNAPPFLQAGFITFGCLNNFCKINQGVLELWTQVLKTVERSRLIMLCPEGSHRQPLLEKLQREGIDPDRIEMIVRRPRSQYLELYNRIDVGLDTFTCNGHTTSLDSLWMGVPVVTLAGQTVFGRAGVSQLNNLGLPELIARTPQQYVEIAAGLAKDLPRLKELRRALRPRMQASALMDAPRFAQNIEAVYRQMWRNWCTADKT